MLYNIGTKTEDSLYNKIDAEELLSKLEAYFNKKDNILKYKIKLYIKNPVNFYKLSTHLNIDEHELIVLLHVIFPDIFSKRMITALSKIYLKPEFNKTAVLKQIAHDENIKKNKEIILQLEHFRNTSKKILSKIKKLKNKNYKFKDKQDKIQLGKIIVACNVLIKKFKIINSKNSTPQSITKTIDFVKTYNKKHKKHE